MNAGAVATHYQDEQVTLLHADVLDGLASLPAESAQCVVTSPPYYGLRDYGYPGQLGLEPTPAEYVARMVNVFAGIRRVLRDDGVAWLNLGDSYSSGHGTLNVGFNERTDNAPGARKQEHARPSLAPTMPPKNMLGIPWRVAFALQDDGWTLRNAIIWHKPNAMPESVADRLSCRYEHLFLLSKSRRYWFDLDPIREQTAERSDWMSWDERKERGGRFSTSNNRGTNSTAATGSGSLAPNAIGKNPGDVWKIATQPYAGAHFATMPPDLARRCILAGSPEGATVLDPFVGSGTVPMVARKCGRNAIGIDANAEYLDLAVRRVGPAALDFEGTA